MVGSKQMYNFSFDEIFNKNLQPYGRPSNITCSTEQLTCLFPY